MCAKSGSRKIFADSKGNVVTIHEMGLMPNHAYAVTDVRKIDTTDGIKSLIRIRNPWGLFIYFCLSDVLNLSFVPRIVG